MLTNKNKRNKNRSRKNSSNPKPEAKDFVGTTKGLAVIDLSLWTGKVSFAWVLTSPQEDAFAKDSKDIWTNPKHMSSFRAALAGLHDTLGYALKHGNISKRIV